MLPVVVLIGMASALVFGSADFLGGLASKRISPIRVTAIAAVVGLAGLWVAYPFFGGVWSWSAVLYGGLSGVSGALAIVLLYACLAIGPMSILSPLTAVVSAIVPAAIGIFVRGEHFGTIGYIALGLALLAVVMVGFVRDSRAVHPTPRGIFMAIGSGVFIGLFLVIIDLTPTDSGLVPLIANRTVNAIIMFSAVGVIALLRRPSTGSGTVGGSGTRSASATVGGSGTKSADRSLSLSKGSGPGTAGDDRSLSLSKGGGWLPGLRLAIACGLVDALANSGLLIGIRIGDLSVIAVLTALYPAGTIILAAIVLRERIAVVQYVGLALAIGAGALLAID